MIVMKFGGTSTQDAAAMTNVARIVRTHLDERPVVVISAIAKGTNMLEEAGKLAAASSTARATEILAGLVGRHESIADELLAPGERRDLIKRHLTRSLEELKELVHGVSILRELTPRTLDAFYCHGELLSSRLVAAVLEEHGVNVRWVDTKDFLVTDEHHNAASPLMDVVEERLRATLLPLMEKGIVPVTQGFIGVTRAGIRTTMGRESSDYSAAILGSALNVSDIQIWTDVDGILTADPRVVTSPRKVKVLSFEEAFELSFFGAKVLHPNTMLPALEKNIPIHIFNSRRPHRSGTRVSSGGESERTIIKSVAYKRNVHLFTVRPRKRLNQFIFWEHIHAVLAKHGVSASLTVTSDFNISLVLENISNCASLIRDLDDVGFVRHAEEKGIICVVGNNLLGVPSAVESLFKATSSIGISLISFGASGSSLSFLVDDQDVPEAVRRIHKEFFEASRDAEMFEEIEDHPAAG
jgi:aspartate kinase